MSATIGHWATTACLLGLLGALTGCRPTGTPGTAADRPRIVVSVGPQAWLAHQLAGPQAEVLTLVRPVDNHHTYQPTDAQVSRVMQAAVYFRVGLPFEKGPWFEAIQASGRLPIVDVREGLTLLPSDEHAPATDNHAAEGEHAAEHDEEGCAHDGLDPHIWLSPRLLKLQARTMAATLKRIDPSHQAEYADNLRALEEQLDQLDAELRQTLAPVQGKAFFVFHPAWGYFAHDYQLQQVAIEREGKQPSDAELTALQQEAKQAGVKAIFVQPQIAGQAAEAVAAAVGARLEVLDPMSEDVPGSLRQAAARIARSYQEKPE